MIVVLPWFNIAKQCKLPDSLIRNQPIEARKVVGHLHHFMKDTALSLIEDTGQEIIDWFYTGSTMAQKNKKFRTRIMNIPRRILFKLNENLTVRLIDGYSLMGFSQITIFYVLFFAASVIALLIGLRMAYVAWTGKMKS